MSPHRGYLSIQINRPLISVQVGFEVRFLQTVSTFHGDHSGPGLRQAAVCVRQVFPHRSRVPSANEVLGGTLFAACVLLRSAAFEFRSARRSAAGFWRFMKTAFLPQITCLSNFPRSRGVAIDIPCSVDGFGERALLSCKALTCAIFAPASFLTQIEGGDSPLNGMMIGSTIEGYFSGWSSTASVEAPCVLHSKECPLDPLAPIQHFRGESGMPETSSL
jgi:hypothetical protein